MSNSPLVSYTKISPNKNANRSHIIDTITPHCVVGQVTVESLGREFSKTSRAASSNYGIGRDGKIGMYVEEKDRSWCSANGDNDNRAITIECASDLTPPYKINDEVYKSLVELCIDICKRNNIKRLKWKGDKTLVGVVSKQNITVHKWFKNTDCPGEYIYNKLGQLTEDVNAELKNYFPEEPELPELDNAIIDKIAMEVINGRWGTGSERTNRLTEAGYDPYEIQTRVNAILNGSYKPNQIPSEPVPSVPVSKPDPVIPEPIPSIVELDEITIYNLAMEVINGRWGTGSERRRRLTQAGYNYQAIQDMVNAIIFKNYKPSIASEPTKPVAPVIKKTIDELAREVINGRWSVGAERKRLLTEAGYDYAAVQKRVNEII